MSEWVDIHVETIMNNTIRYDGQTVYGLAHYLNQIIAQQTITNKLLAELLKRANKNE